MSSKAAPRKTGVIFAVALALSSVFNAGVSAAQTFTISGDFSDPARKDENNVTVPGCRNAMNQVIKFVPRPIEQFMQKPNLYFAFDYSHSKAVNDGPTVFYNSQLLGMMPEPFQNFMMYNACILNYHGDQALRNPINRGDYTVSEIKADCSAVIRLRDENRLTPANLDTITALIDVELSNRNGPPNAKTERRIRNMTQCYYRNMTTENITPSLTPSRG